jgi:hypothetical protein
MLLLLRTVSWNEHPGSGSTLGDVAFGQRFHFARTIRIMRRTGSSRTSRGGARAGRLNRRRNRNAAGPKW